MTLEQYLREIAVPAGQNNVAGEIVLEDAAQALNTTANKVSLHIGIMEHEGKFLRLAQSQDKSKFFYMVAA